VLAVPMTRRPAARLIVKSEAERERWMVLMMVFLKLLLILGTPN
jgi:hypothetical protein